MEEDGFENPSKINNRANYDNEDETAPNIVKNRFGVLRNAKEGETTPRAAAMENKTTRKQWFPPITITSTIEEYTIFIKVIEERLGGDNFTMKYKNNNTKIYTKTIADFGKMNRELKNEETEY